MTPQEIIENNILIAEFMGWKTKDIKQFVLLYDYSPNRDWNQLIKVVKAIGDKTEHELVSGHNYSYWNRYGENPILDKEDNPQEFGGYSDIINIYEACVTFVKWYTQNKGGN